MYLGAEAILYSSQLFRGTFCPSLDVIRILEVENVYGKVNHGCIVRPLYRGCPFLEESIIKGFTVKVRQSSFHTFAKLAAIFKRLLVACPRP